MTPASPRRGMTLIEILVAVMILAVISLAMIGILLTSGELFRRGEYGKSASDEAMTVIAKLDDDLLRFVPAADGGFLYAKASPSPLPLFSSGPYIRTPVSLDGAGDSVLAFVTTAKDPSRRGVDGKRARTLVAWWVEQPTAPDERPILWRAEMPAGGPSGALGERDDEQRVFDLISRAYLDPAVPGNAAALRFVEAAQVTTGVLHFGAWLSLADDVRAGEWDNATNATTYPAGYDTSLADPFATPPITVSPAEAIRVTVCLTGGGRFALRGTLREDIAAGSTAPFAVSGVSAIPLQPGSMLRIGDEWIGYDGYLGGRIRLDSATASGPVGRGQRRSAATSHTRGATAWFGQSYALVRSLPR